MRSARHGTIPLAALCVACGGTEPPPPRPTPPVASITVSSDVSQTIVLAPVEATAVVRDASGAVLDVPVTWDSRGPAGQSGLPSFPLTPRSARFTPNAVGTWTLEARSGTVTGTAVVTADPRQPTSVSLELTRSTLAVGEEITATAKAFWPDPAHPLSIHLAPPVTWSTSAHLLVVSTNAATGTAVLRGVTAGTAIITIRSGTQEGGTALTVQ